MNDEQNTETNKSPAYGDLMPAQKERLRAALQILTDYLLENGSLTQFRHSSQKTENRNPSSADTASPLSGTDSL